MPNPLPLAKIVMYLFAIYLYIHYYLYCRKKKEKKGVRNFFEFLCSRDIVRNSGYEPHARVWPLEPTIIGLAIKTIQFGSNCSLRIVFFFKAKPPPPPFHRSASDCHAMKREIIIFIEMFLSSFLIVLCKINELYRTSKYI